ncbi:hypothetical protein ACVNIS_10370 [Sphaerotilaceae bacterium SBD11-9]
MQPLAVLASGMVTAIGFNAPSTLAALRAGISGVKATRWTDPEAGAPLRGAKISLPQWSETLGKLADLLAAAIHECLQQAHPEPPAAIPLLIGVASPARAGRTPRLDEDLLDELHARLEIPRHPDSRLFPSDETGCVQALLTADALLAAGRARLAVVAGVDSFLHQATLTDYLRRRRVMTEGNSNGFFPGEAASAVLIGQPGKRAGDELHLIGFGQARENATILDTTPLRATGLTDAMKQALAGAGVALKDVAYRLTDLSGEHYKFKEAAFAAGRLNGGEREVPLDLWHPIEYLGAIGAAILPCLLAQAFHAAQHGYAPGPLALCHLGNDAGDRAALVVRLQRNGSST